jgi:hypothetical protein
MVPNAVSSAGHVQKERTPAAGMANVQDAARIAQKFTGKCPSLARVSTMIYAVVA